MFGYAKEHEPCIIFMDEIDAIGGRRFSEGTSADREIQRTLMELLNQLDGFDYLGKTKIIMATNRPDTLDPALLRAGRLDRKIEIPLPNEAGRLEVLKIHAGGGIWLASVLQLRCSLRLRGRDTATRSAGEREQQAQEQGWAQISYHRILVMRIHVSTVMITLRKSCLPIHHIYRKTPLRGTHHMSLQLTTRSMTQ